MCSSLLKCFQHVFAVVHVKKRKGFHPKRQSPPPLSPVPIKKIEIQACIVIEIGERPPLIEINRSDASSILFRDPCDTRCVSYMEVSKPPFANNNYALSSNAIRASASRKGISVASNLDRLTAKTKITQITASMSANVVMRK